MRRKALRFGSFKIVSHGFQEFCFRRWGEYEVNIVMICSPGDRSNLVSLGKGVGQESSESRLLTFTERHPKWVKSIFMASAVCGTAGPLFGAHKLVVSFGGSNFFGLIVGATAVAAVGLSKVAKDLVENKTPVIMLTGKILGAEFDEKSSRWAVVLVKVVKLGVAAGAVINNLVFSMLSASEAMTGESLLCLEPTSGQTIALSGCGLLFLFGGMANLKMGLDGLDGIHALIQGLRSHRWTGWGIVKYGSLLVLNGWAFSGRAYEVAKLLMRIGSPLGWAYFAGFYSFLAPGMYTLVQGHKALTSKVKIFHEAKISLVRSKRFSAGSGAHAYKVTLTMLLCLSLMGMAFFLFSSWLPNTGSAMDWYENGGGVSNSTLCLANTSASPHASFHLGQDALSVFVLLAGVSQMFRSFPVTDMLFAFVMVKLLQYCFRPCLSEQALLSPRSDKDSFAGACVWVGGRTISTPEGTECDSENKSGR